MPVLDLAFRVHSGKDVPGLEVGVLWPPGDVREGSLLLLILQGVAESLLLHIEDHDSSILAGYIQESSYLLRCTYRHGKTWLNIF